MPFSVTVRDCTHSNKCDHISLNISEQTDSVSSLMTEIAEKIQRNKDELDIVYCGQKLAHDRPLNTYLLTLKPTLFVFKKGDSVEGKPDLPGAHEVLHILQKTLQNPAFRKCVDQLMTRQREMQKLMAAVPGLASDPVALSMLQDPELLSILAHRQNIHKVLKTHPAFGPAALYFARVVEEERSRDGNRQSRSAVYSLDQMSDDEEDGHQVGAGASGVQQITASQLAAALAEATASSSPSASRSPAASISARGGSGSAMISPDFFQQAMLQAQNAALDAQLQQLRDMGITDENVARQALRATGGDLQAALDIIFGDGSTHSS